MGSASSHSWTKRQVLNWFGDRGEILKPGQLKRWHWEDGKVYFMIDGITDPGEVGLAITHAEDGRPVLIYELEDLIPFEKSPFAEDGKGAPMTIFTLSWLSGSKKPDPGDWHTRFPPEGAKTATPVNPLDATRVERDAA
jgi:hypothetical protein